MKQIMILVVLAVITLVVMKLRADAARQRKAVLSRLSSLVPEDLSPTERLFQQAAAPGGTTLSVPLTDPRLAAASDLLDLPETFRRIEPDDGDADVATFLADRSTDEVRTELLAHFARPGCTTTWVGRNEVRVAQDGSSALLSLRDDTDTNGGIASAHRCVVRLTLA